MRARCAQNVEPRDDRPARRETYASRDRSCGPSSEPQRPAARPSGGWNRRLRRKAKEQATAEREQARRARAVVAERTSRRRRPRSEYEAWLDEHDAREPLTRADRHSQSDEKAARVVADGGGMRAVIEATGLRTLENVVGLIDPAILTRALDNDVLERGQRPPV